MAWNEATTCCPFFCLSVDGIPYDGVPKDETVTVHIAVTVTLSVLATCGIIMTIVFLIFNFGFRKRKWAQSSPTFDLQWHVSFAVHGRICHKFQAGIGSYGQHSYRQAHTHTPSLLTTDSLGIVWDHEAYVTREGRRGGWGVVYSNYMPFSLPPWTCADLSSSLVPISTTSLEQELYYCIWESMSWLFPALTKLSWNGCAM